jgi:Mg2+ and Co2+ transporter CorA
LTELLPEPRWPGLIWGYDIVAGRAGAPGDELPPGGFRWLHIALSDQRALAWIAARDDLPPLVREVLLSADDHPRALIDDSGIIACVIHDNGRAFDGEEDVLRGLRFVLTPDLMLTARHHPVRCADLVRRRFESGAGPANAAAALDLLISTSIAEANGRLQELSARLRTMEDALVDHEREPEARSLRRLRRRAVHIHRQAGGLHAILARLEEDEALPEPLLPPVERLIQRAAGLEGDVAGLIGQERQLREELAALAGNRTNRNLYVLSLMTALMLPPTLVAGLFGMNTGGLPFAHAPHGTLIAVLLASASTLATYLLLRGIGFFRS